MGKSRTGGQDRDSHLKVLRLAREAREKEREEKNNELDSMGGVDKLKFDIGNLENTVKLCDYDLSTPTLRGNSAIINKKRIAEESLKLKKIELNNILNITIENATT